MHACIWTFKDPASHSKSSENVLLKISRENSFFICFCG